MWPVLLVLFPFWGNACSFCSVTQMIRRDLSEKLSCTTVHGDIVFYFRQIPEEYQRDCWPKFEGNLHRPTWDFFSRLALVTILVLKSRIFELTVWTCFTQMCHTMPPKKTKKNCVAGHCQTKSSTNLLIAKPYLGSDWMKRKESRFAHKNYIPRDVNPSVYHFPILSPLKWS